MISFRIKSPATLALTACVVGAVVAAVVFLAGYAADCESRWKDSGFEFEWRDGTCFVLAGSRWLPEANVTVYVPKED